MTDATALDPKVVCIFSPIGESHALLKYSTSKTTEGVKYSTLNDEWLYKTANDEPFAYE